MAGTGWLEIIEKLTPEERKTKVPCIVRLKVKDQDEAVKKRDSYKKHFGDRKRQESFIVREPGKKDVVKDIKSIEIKALKEPDKPGGVIGGSDE